MGDFFLDLRSADERRHAAAQAATSLKWCEDTDVKTFEGNSFSLVLSRTDGFELWGPAEHSNANGRVFVAVAGRIAMDEGDWETARSVGNSGGLACNAVLANYLQIGCDAFSTLNGNFAAFVCDERTHQFHLATDRCGMFLAYSRVDPDRSPVFCSHPDVLASILGEEQRLDEISLAEFLTTGKLTFPYTYYQQIRALETGAVFTFPLQDVSGAASVRRRFFHFDFKIDPAATEEDLAEALAKAFGNAVRRRSLGLLGRTGVALSGGLDSRAILSTVRHDGRVHAFNLFDEPNPEYRTARSLAEACGAEFAPIRRDFEYYANSAELGVRISGGVGNIASNHFLGARKQLSQLGIENVLTGCYCDYLLKGLSLNTSEQTISRRERLVPFNFQFYHRHYWNTTRQNAHVQERLERCFPESQKTGLSDHDCLHVERKRAFPLAYEGDLAQRTIPQRVIPWFLPIADNDILDIYLRIPSRFKLNASIFKRMVLLLCDEKVCHVPDSNTGAPLSASSGRYSWHRYLSALRNRISQKAIPRMATRGSWPNWAYYLRHSAVIPTLWARRNPVATDVFIRLLGADPLQRPPHSFEGRDIEYFMRLFTLKLWLDQRAGLRPLT